MNSCVVSLDKETNVNYNEYENGKRTLATRSAVMLTDGKDTPDAVCCFLIKEGKLVKLLKRITAIVLIVLILLGVFWGVGRYGWKLFGFRAAQGAVVESIEVMEDGVHITGCYPGSFPCGFLGYVSKEYDGCLYVGYHFSGLFGFFETGSFDITIPVKGEIREIWTKTDKTETRIWSVDGLIS